MIGRPTKTEAADYYFTYINQVTGDDIKAVLATQLEESALCPFGTPASTWLCEAVRQ
jgi:hypothetical protein